ncbi:hypothetical protein L208DRAFT_1405097 [Tricholoma matsutake]|nr:hypothetical protein L208DRAFT_1405097 [Tricholoma matsutake 945]
MVDSPVLNFPRSLARAPNIDISQIKGNVTDEQKQLEVNVLFYFTSSRQKSYGADIGRRLKIVEMNVWDKGKDGPAAYGETIFEIEIQEDMCNVFGTLHGACAAYMVDPCSVSSLVLLGLATGVDGIGVSQSMNLIWHQPVCLGDKLRIVATSMFIHGHVRSARCEFWKGDQLCLSAVHSTVNPWQTRTKRGKL